MMNEQLTGKLKKGLMIVVSAPAGTGKTTLVHKLIAEFPKSVTQSISCTTRKPRDGEIDGKDYVFLTKEAFEKRIQRGEFLEYATVFGDHYGTLKETVEKQREAGKHVVLVIDTQGALKLKNEIDGVFIFVAPPNFDVLRERLENRQTETKEVREKRLEWAKFEMEQAKQYDYQVVNDDLETAYEELKNIVIAEEQHHRKSD